LEVTVFGPLGFRLVHLLQGLQLILPDRRHISGAVVGVFQVVGVVESGLRSPAEVESLRVVQRLQLLDAVAGIV
jgi:hypothetical protein